MTKNMTTKLLDNIFAHHGVPFLVSLILLTAILFALALYIYAKWLLAQAHHQRRSSLSRPGFLDPTHFPSANSLTVDTTRSAKSLDASTIASIPLFVYDGRKSGLECVVCLSLFEDKEMGKRLPDCGHGFHVECIDMWLSSHSSCPVCRVGVRVGGERKVIDIDSMSNSVVNEDSASDIVVDVDSMSNRVEVLSHSSSALCYSGVEGWSNSTSARVSLSARLSSSSLSSQIAAMSGSLMRLMSRNT